MPAVKLNVLRIIDHSQPGFAECELVDCHGNSHYFVDKLPVIGDYDSVPPCAGKARCHILETRKITFVIDTSLPDDIESTTGEYQFEVYQDQVIL